jgi:uncharacterized tellurite resistance protein B-like protein
VSYRTDRVQRPKLEVHLGIQAEELYIYPGIQAQELEVHPQTSRHTERMRRHFLYGQRLEVVEEMNEIHDVFVTFGN